MTDKKKIPHTITKKTKPMESIDDAAITAKFKALLEADDFLRSLTINVKTNDGVVLLVGDVPSQESLSKIQELVHKVKGVKKIIANLEITN